MGRAVTGVALVAMASLVACIRANTVECGDLSCPEALQCVAERCVTTEQVESCRTLLEGDACNAAGVINGHCIGGACVDSICGNGIEELGEVCDDGNLVGEDDCSARCDSDETCGNATVDLFREQCDEGIASLSGDGCSSRCAVEYPTWRRETPRELSARYDHAMVTIERPNPGESSILLFGGTATSSATNETWLWRGNQWRQLLPRTSPPATKLPVLAYDQMRDRVVLFVKTDAALGVWEWDGVDWSQRTQTGQGPTVVIAAGYHVLTKQLIAFDGSGTFEWNATGWVNIMGRQPPPRSATAIAYFKRSDASGELVMFGGRGATLLNDTWVFDGDRWTAAQSGAKPPARQSAMMTGDPFGRRVVLFGGADDNMTFGDTWLYDGAWQLAPDTSVPRRNGAIAYDPASADHQLLVYGGQNMQGMVANTLGDQEGYRSQWVPIANPVKPTALCNATLAYLPAVGATVFTAVDKAWGWDGIQWIKSPAAPTQRCTAAAASSPTGNEVVMFSGNIGASYYRDTWTWNGTTWTVSPVLNGALGERKAHAMALDERAGRTVLFGGLGPLGTGGTGVGAVYSDTWEWDGSAWVLRPTVGAPARQGHALAFDRTTQTLVVFGGSDKDGLLATTFELDGMTWHSHVTAHSPLATPPLVMATGSRGRPIVVDAARQTWELQRENNIVDWVQLPTIGTPPALAFSTLAYDPLRDQLLHVGAVSGEVQVWSLTFVSPQPRESCVANADVDGDMAAGCADPDCWATCDPQCPPIEAMTCATSRLRCGDGTCTALEDYQVCPADCPLPP